MQGEEGHVTMEADCSDAATAKGRQAVTAAARSYSLQEPLEGTSPVNTLILDLRLPEP